MNNIRHTENLIQKFKDNFLQETGRSVKVIICNKWEGHANFTNKADFWGIVKLVLDYTGWKWEDTYFPRNKKGGLISNLSGERKPERVFRRQVIDYICINNGITMVECAKNTGRCDHTVVSHGMTKFENTLQTDYYTQKLFSEICTYVKDNYYLVKGKSTLKNEVLGNLTI